MPGASVRAAAGALSFLTRVPVGRSLDLRGEDVERGAVVFPLVGAAVGAVAGGAAVVLHPWLPSLVAAAVAVALAALVTGGLHLDALADTFDGLGASSRERALEIMRDPRIGSFGAGALVFDTLLRVAAISALLDRGGAFRSLVAAGALSRASSPALAAVLPYARAGGGTGSVLTPVRLAAAAVAAVGAIAATVLLLGLNGVWLALAAVATAAGLGVIYRRWLGGVTGDCLGAAIQLAETIVLVIAAGVAA